MAKRLRLTPPQEGYLADTRAHPAGTEPKTTLAAPFGAGPAPIARVAAEASAMAALDQVSEEFRRARAEGRLIQSIPLEAVVEDHLVRDRIAVEADDLAALTESLRARGQQTPIEVVDLGGGRFGLISGWRRLAALRGLLQETGEARFATVLALLRRPADAPAAYVAMVEENEIRIGLSYYERARIVARAVDQGVFSSRKEALQSLFSTASRAKRSKIGSFLALVSALDDGLRFPSRIGERLGLALAQALEADPGLGPRLVARLASLQPAEAGAEQALLARAASGRLDPPAPTPPPTGPVAPVTLEQRGRRLVLSGPGVDAAFRARLEAWLAGSG